MRPPAYTFGKNFFFRLSTSGVLALLAGIAPMTALAQATPEEPPPAESDSSIQSLDGISVVGSTMASNLQVESGASMGFQKSLLETPRTVSFIDSEQIGLLGINTVDDLSRAVPGTFTTTRYGLQGGINVRGIAADMFFRGMKRLNMQGHARTNLAAMDSIEVVKGPPSPIYGMGKIGGYTNLTPKSGHAANGAYLEAPSGFLQAIGGSYDRTEVSGAVEGPMQAFGRQGGYYVYGLMEDSESYIEQVSVQQKILQASISIDDAVGPFRLETGFQWQNSKTQGSYMNRVTQALIDNGQYVTGMPLAHLDLNGDGAIGFRETHLGSPIVGNVSGNNRPLWQAFQWPTCGGAPCAPGDFPTISGIPASLYDYIIANDLNDPTSQLLLSQGVGGVLPASGYIPIGFALNPTQTGYTDVNFRRNGSYEQLQDAKLGLVYFDLIYDINPDFTLKSQFFYDRLDSFKNSQLPYGEKQDIRVWEEKVTATLRIPDDKLPDWLRINSLASVNYRETRSFIASSGGDFDWRQDVMYNGGFHVPNTLFWNQLDDASFETGAPITNDRDTWFNEMGVGLMFDVDMFESDTGFFRGTNLLLGARYDRSHARGWDHVRFNENASTADVATYLPEQYASGTDSGKSWSVSLSQQLPWGLRPYATFASSSVTLDSANNSIFRATITSPGGHIGDADLTEYGLKADLFDGKVGVTLSRYTQTRTDVSSNEDPTLGAEVSSTETKGWETEVKWAPTRQSWISAYAVFQKAKYLFNSSTTYMLDGRQLGFQDVVDPVTGEVVYPAEAFLYGGRTTITVPAAVLANYMDRTGNPEEQYGINAGYDFENGFGILLGGTKWTSVWADRLQTLRLPAATVINAALTYNVNNWQFKVNGYNIFDERYFRARNSDTAPGLVSVMPGRRVEFTARFDF